MKKKFFTKKRYIIIFIAAVLLIGGFVSAKFLAPQDKSEYVTEKVVKKDLLQTVSEVGMVKADEKAELSFPAGGKLENKFVKTGDIVKIGGLLAELDYKTLQIQRFSAESSLASAQANLKKLISGASYSDIAVLDAQVSEAQKASQSASVNLDKTKKTVAEEIRQAEKNLNDLQVGGENNQTTYEQNVASTLSILNNTKETYQKTINNSIEILLADVGAKLTIANTALDNLFAILDNDDLKDSLSSKNKIHLINTQINYDMAKALALPASVSLTEALADKSETKVKKSATNALAYLNKTIESLNDCYSALEASTISQTTLDGYKTNINSQLSYSNAAFAVVQVDKQALDGAYLSYNSNVSAVENNWRAAVVALDNAITAAKNVLIIARLNGDQRITSAEANLQAAQERLAVAKSQLAKLKSPARSEDISLANSQIAQAQSSLELVNKQISDSVLRSPIDGQIVSDNFERGEQVMPGQAVFSILGENNYKIEVDISESDIIKIKKNDQAEITLDSFGDDRKFLSYVDFIEPAQTIIQDVVYYRVTLKFSDSGEQLAGVKPGMTANIKIVTAQQNKVLVVSERAIIDKAGNKIIRILRAGKIVESPVKTGLRGDGGLIEITSGAAENDDAVVFVNTPKK